MSKVKKSDKVDPVKDITEEDNTEDIDNIDTEESFITEDTINTNIVYKTENKISKPFLTRYEKALILAKRIEQLYNGAKPLIKIENKNLISVEDIAKIELEKKIIPFKVVRTLGSNNEIKEVWKISELEIL